MPKPTGASWRAIKRHHNYTVEEAARRLVLSRGTVRRWIAKGLPALTDRKPFLILGDDLIAYLKQQRRPRTRCGPGEFYCLRCKVPRRAALEMAEVVDRNAASLNLRAICTICEALMHRRVSRARLRNFAAGMEVSEAQASTRIGEPADPCLNAHFEKAPETHA